jgi:hypothetical protein
MEYNCILFLLSHCKEQEHFISLCQKQPGPDPIIAHLPHQHPTPWSIHIPMSFKQKLPASNSQICCTPESWSHQTTASMPSLVIRNGDRPRGSRTCRSPKHWVPASTVSTTTFAYHKVSSMPKNAQILGPLWQSPFLFQAPHGSILYVSPSSSNLSRFPTKSS